MQDLTYVDGAQKDNTVSKAEFEAADSCPVRCGNFTHTQDY